MFIYPDARSGKELKIRFKITSEMCAQSCVRDMIQVEVSDAYVTIHGTPIKAANGELELKLKR